jgi:hypothetical protein
MVKRNAHFVFLLIALGGCSLSNTISNNNDSSAYSAGIATVEDQVAQDLSNKDNHDYMNSAEVNANTLNSTKMFAHKEDFFLEEGSITISRPIPRLPDPTLAAEPARVMSFMPVAPQIPDFGLHASADTKMWVFIDTVQKTLLINRGDENILSAPIDHSQGIKQGKFSIVLKQSDPLWYAPDEYFAKRNQSIPPSGSSDRFRKGALGVHAIFLEEDLVLHSSPLKDPSINGVQISASEMVSIYSILEPGTEILVR